jgi:hypothetical protein
MSQGVVDTPPSDIYVALFDQGGTEVSTDFANDRVQTAAGTDWTTTGTGFENANLIDFGEATTDITDIQDVALFDAATGGNELARYDMDNSPFNIADGSSLEFLTGDLSFDVVDRTE